MALLDADRVIVAINDAYAKTFGYSRDNAVGKYAESFIPSATWNQLAADWNRLLRNGAATGTREIVRADKRLVKVQDAARHEVVTGRNLILYVVLETEPARPRDDGHVSRPAALSRREIQVVSELAMGRRIREIADNLHMAPTTAQTHARHAMAKLGARSQAHLVAIALAEGQLDSDVVLRHD
jgi:PAS domain S-box-containing protein